LNSLAHQLGLELAANRLHLGQLGHVPKASEAGAPSGVP
jgi:hypothetical protein